MSRKWRAALVARAIDVSRACCQYHKVHEQHGDEFELRLEREIIANVLDVNSNSSRVSPNDNANAKKEIFNLVGVIGHYDADELEQYAEYVFGDKRKLVALQQKLEQTSPGAKGRTQKIAVAPASECKYE